VSYLPSVSTVQYVTSQQTQQTQEQATGMPVRLERTTEPVWPEDEAAEEAELARPGATPVPFMEDDEADAVLRSISVTLPDRLTALSPQDSQKKTLGLAHPVPGIDHIALQVPVSFSAPESLILRRVRLTLVFSSDNTAIPPVAICMEPRSDVEVKTREIGEAGVDLGKVLTAMLPLASGMFTARVGSKIETVSVHPKVKAYGVNLHECWWRVSDSEIAYGFNPAVIVQFAEAASVTVSAKLHVDVRKRVLGAWRKTYGKDADPRWYSYHAGHPLMAAYDYLENLARLGWAAIPAQRDATGTNALLALGELAQKQGLPEAEQWYRRAADAGRVSGMTSLGMLLDDRDPAEAEQWYQRAIAIGNGPIVMQNLGRDYEKRDRIKAERWYRLAAAAGDDTSMLLLGRLLAEQDPNEAEQWYLRAARAGNGYAREHLKKVHFFRYRLLRRPY
jgi:hypothetical protein